MIKIFLGNVGSGKTACAVRELVREDHIVTYTNIKTKKVKNQILIKPEMIIKQEELGEKRDGTKNYKYSLNDTYWKEAVKKHKKVSVILDEAHTILNSRRAMSQVNIIVTNWLSLVRRVLGSSDGSQGELTFITQLPNRIDIVAREMATQIRFHLCHYQKSCLVCGRGWFENSEMPEKLNRCPCGSFKLEKHSHKIEVWYFSKMQDYQFFKEFGAKTFYKHIIVHDIEKYFPLYDTMQWENLFESFYS